MNMFKACNIEPTEQVEWEPRRFVLFSPYIFNVEQYEYSD